ncbi:MAG: CopG family ribbon-helix-helix protein [Myxococcales bacterium]
MKAVKRKARARQSFEELEKLAQDTSDLKPLSPSMRRKWEAARRTGAKPRPGRPRKDPKLKSRIVPVSMDPALLKEVDRYADAAGVTRSRLIAEALRLRIGA